MQIKTAKDVEKLDLKIQEELGIDVRKYRNEEVVENFAELIVFPGYVVNWGIRPVLISFTLYILGFFVVDLVHVQYVLYAILGLALFLLVGVFSGLLFLTWKMKSDIWSIIDYSLSIMKSAVSDLNQVNNQITPENRKNVLGLLFKGIIHIVTIPMLSQIISDKVPLIGGLITGFIKRILTLVANVVKFDEVELKQELRKDKQAPNAIQVYSKSISAVSTGLEKTVGFTFGVAQLPLKIGFVFSFSFLVLFLYLIW